MKYFALFLSFVVGLLCLGLMLLLFSPPALLNHVLEEGINSNWLELQRERVPFSKELKRIVPKKPNSSFYFQGIAFPMLFESSFAFPSDSCFKDLNLCQIDYLDQDSFKRNLNLRFQKRMRLKDLYPKDELFQLPVVKRFLLKELSNHNQFLQTIIKEHGKTFSHSFVTSVANLREILNQLFYLKTQENFYFQFGQPIFWSPGSHFSRLIFKDTEGSFHLALFEPGEVSFFKLKGGTESSLSSYFSLISRKTEMISSSLYHERAFLNLKPTERARPESMIHLYLSQFEKKNGLLIKENLKNALAQRIQRNRRFLEQFFGTIEPIEKKEVSPSAIQESQEKMKENPEEIVEPSLKRKQKDKRLIGH